MADPSSWPALPAQIFYDTNQTGPLHKGNLNDDLFITGLMLGDQEGKARLFANLKERAEAAGFDAAQRSRGPEATKKMDEIISQVKAANESEYGWSRVRGAWVHEGLKRALLRIRANERRKSTGYPPSPTPSQRRISSPAAPSSSRLSRPPLPSPSLPAPSLLPIPPPWAPAAPAAPNLTTPLHLMNVRVKVHGTELVWQDALTTFQTQASRLRPLAQLTYADLSFPDFKATLANHEQSPFGFDSQQHQLVYTSGGNSSDVNYDGEWRSALCDCQRSCVPVVNFIICPKIRPGGRDLSHAAPTTSGTAAESATPALPTHPVISPERTNHPATPDTPIGIDESVGLVLPGGSSNAAAESTDPTLPTPPQEMIESARNSSPPPIPPYRVVSHAEISTDAAAAAPPASNPPTPGTHAGGDPASDDSDDDAPIVLRPKRCRPVIILSDDDDREAPAHRVSKKRKPAPPHAYDDRNEDVDGLNAPTPPDAADSAVADQGFAKFVVNALQQEDLFEDASSLPVLAQFSEPLWQLMCRFYRHDPNKHSNAAGDVVMLPGFRQGHEPRTFQAFAVHWMFGQLEKNIYGGIVADGVGVGKTTEVLLYIWTQCEIAAAGLDMERFRRGEPHAQPHLLPSTPDAPQAEDAVCPSQHSWGVECPCVEASLSSVVWSILPNGPVLVAVPPKLISQWQMEFEATFTTTHRDRSRRLELFIEHHEMPASAFDRSPYYPSSLRPDGFKRNCTRFVVLTAANKTLHSRIAGNPTFQVPDRSFWSALFWDEFHEARNPEAIPGAFFYQEMSKYTDEVHEFPCFFALSATPIVKDVGDILAIVQALEDRSWGQKGERMESLGFSTQARIRELARDYRQMLKEVPLDDDGSADARRQTRQKADYCFRLSQVLENLMICRKATDTWFAEQLVPLPPLHTQELLVGTDAAYIDAIQHIADRAQAEAETRYQNARTRWIQRGSVGPPPQRADAKLAGSLSMRRVRLCGSFPRFAQPPLHGSDVGAQLIQDRQLYTTTDAAVLRRVWYGQFLTYLMHGSRKVQELTKFIQEMEERDPSAKMMIACSGPAVVVLVRLVLERLFPQMGTIVIHPGMSSADRAMMIRSFNGIVVGASDHAVGTYELPAAAMSRLMVFSMNVVSTGYNCQRVNHVCVFDLPWTHDKLYQTVGRAWRSGQLKAVYVKILISGGNGVEMKIWQSIRLHRDVTEVSFDMTTGGKAQAQERRRAAVINEPRFEEREV